MQHHPRVAATGLRAWAVLSRVMVALIALSALLPVSSAGAAPGAAGKVVDNPDAIAYAERYNVSIDEAGHRLDLQGRAGDLSAWLDENARDWTGGLYIQHEPVFKVVILGLDSVAPGLSQAIQATSLSGLTTIEIVDHTLADLAEDAAALAAELPGTLLRVDVMANEVVVEAVSEAVVDRAVRSAKLHAPPRFVQSNRKAVPIAFIYAGQIMDWQGESWCTIGFSMVKAGVRRTSTAGHCPDTEITRNGVALGIIAGAYGGSHDEQLMSTGSLVPTNRTLDGSRDAQTLGYRNITGKRTRANQAINSYFCRYGWASAGNFGCGHLISKNAIGAMNNPSPTSMWLAADDGSDLASPGDSGGPVFTGATALGIMHACLSTSPPPIQDCPNPNLQHDLLYIAIDYVESGLGATVLTVP